jgi:hypothetical protein
MPLDHYVPQVYLRGFYSHELGERLHAIHKSDMRYFTPGTKAICAITDGSTNEYLREDRLIEEFLRPSAEATVFFSKKMAWVKRFVYRNSRFRIEIRSFNFPTENGEIRLFKHEIAGIVSDLQ